MSENEGFPGVVFLQVEIYLPVAALGHHDGSDIRAGCQCDFGIFVRSVFPEHRRVPVALRQFKGCDCLVDGRLIVCQGQERKLSVEPCVLALRPTTSGLTVLDIHFAESTIRLGAEQGRCIASTLPAHHLVVPSSFEEEEVFGSSRSDGGTAVSSVRAVVLRVASELIHRIDAAAIVFRPR